MAAWRRRRPVRRRKSRPKACWCWISTVALQCVQREASGGQRTTVDVLNAQQDLILAKARLIGAQRDRVIASYTLLSAIGRLDVKTLGLNTPDYLPEVHYHQVRDAWHGLRTPSGQ